MLCPSWARAVGLAPDLRRTKESLHTSYTSKWHSRPLVPRDVARRIKMAHVAWLQQHSRCLLVALKRILPIDGYGLRPDTQGMIDGDSRYCNCKERGVPVLSHSTIVSQVIFVYRKKCYPPKMCSEASRLKRPCLDLARPAKV